MNKTISTTILVILGVGILIFLASPYSNPSKQIVVEKHPEIKELKEEGKITRVKSVTTTSLESAAAPTEAIKTQILKKKSHPLRIEEAFKVAFDSHHELHTFYFDIQRGYKIYTDKVVITSSEELQSVTKPSGERYIDELFGETEVYHGNVSIPVVIKAKAENYTVKIAYQGCWEGGVCYPPTSHEFNVKKN